MSRIKTALDDTGLGMFYELLESARECEEGHKSQYNSIKMESYLVSLLFGLGELLLQSEDVLVQQLVLALQREGVVRLKL